MESKVLFQPILSLSQRGGKLPATTATSSPATGQMFADVKPEMKQ